MSDYTHPQSFVGTQWVADHLDDPTVRVVEIVWGSSPAFGQPAYDAKHIPGALSWDFAADLQDGERQDLVDKSQLEALLGNSGIRTETTIILYSGLNNLLATYAFWLLKIYGHQDVRLLDGDRQKWLDENRPTHDQPPTVSSTSYHAQEPDWRLRANRQDVLLAIGKRDPILLDARSAEMYDGLDKAGVARGGHIPGAINLAARRETNADGAFKNWRVPTVRVDGTFKPAEELRSMFEALGLTPDREIITYCLRGGLSTHVWFVLTQLLGYSHVREYDRSWAEWGNLDGVPVEP